MAEVDALKLRAAASEAELQAMRAAVWAAEGRAAAAETLLEQARVHLIPRVSVHHGYRVPCVYHAYATRMPWVCRADEYRGRSYLTLDYSHPGAVSPGLHVCSPPINLHQSPPIST